MSVTLVDTGPLVAYLSGDDREHDWALAAFDSLPPPVLTCEAVITETCSLSRTSRNQTGDTIVGNDMAR